MQIYSCEISDMKVCLFSNGLDNLVAKADFDLAPDSDFSDADVILIFSAREDKAVAPLMDRLYAEGVTAGLVLAVYSVMPEKCHELADVTVSAAEGEMLSALNGLLHTLDCYSHINSVDVGYELSDFGRASYKGGVSPSLADVKNSIGTALSSSTKAFLLIRVPEDVWTTELSALADELSELVPSCNVAMAATRGSSAIEYSLYIAH